MHITYEWFEFGSVLHIKHHMDTEDLNKNKILL